MQADDGTNLCDDVLRDEGKMSTRKTNKTSLCVKIQDCPLQVVPREAYVKAKTKQLRDFGYNDLTEEHVNEQVDAVLAKKEFGDGLTIIGKFMEGELVA